ncbi:MAG: hypothetical protein KDA60_07855 [Planctomycetales bacterium]|nr:hypothetical protein [Planctomycetales bacterium]
MSQLRTDNRRREVLPGVLLLLTLAVAQADQTPGYSRISPVQPTILGAAKAFPGGAYLAENIIRPVDSRGRRAEYASHGLGEKTFIDFDLGQAKDVCGFRHVQRATPDVILASDLLFCDSPDFRQPQAHIAIRHTAGPGAVTFQHFELVTARYVRWQVTHVAPDAPQNVGGQHLQFFSLTGQRDATPTDIHASVSTLPVVERRDNSAQCPVRVTLTYPYAEPLDATVSLGTANPLPVRLTFGEQTIDLAYSAPQAGRHDVPLSVTAEGQTLVRETVTIDPSRVLTIYILPHSHTDIGYTAIQTEIEEKQINNLIQGLAEARRTAHYPEGARFVWNVEVSWAADIFLDRLPAESRAEFLTAVRDGQVALNGMYLNELTGLCRPEELIRLFRRSTQLSELTGVPIRSAMISDVPGYTWGTVAAMNQAGVRYFSVAPNYFDRIGDILVQWENKPFWWVGPDGQSRVLVWIPLRGYALSHIHRHLTDDFVQQFCEDLQTQEYPFDIAYVRWSGHGDNAPPDASICDFVKKWNATHSSPHFIIASTDTAFQAFDQHYGDQLPEVRGDWTPYWEDGAGSSAYETALNRNSSERLAQAESLWAMLAARRYPAAKFKAAWDNTLLYSEHTWGAHCSISRPTVPFTLDQWNIKQSYALTANLQSRQLLLDAVHCRDARLASSGQPTGEPFSESMTYVDIYNTTSWPRSELALVPRELSRPGDQVTDQDGSPALSQRLASDELAIWVESLPPFSGRRYTIAPGKGTSSGDAKATGTTLTNEFLRLTLDEQHGGIIDLRLQGVEQNLVDTSDGHAVNDYLYLLGDNPADLQKNEPVSITVRDAGPLVASLLVESAAPGCQQLTREVRVVSGQADIELLNTVDKQRLEANNYFENAGKESVNFAFPFHVPDGEMRLNVPLGVMRPEQDQIPSACKNWLTVGRWGEIANAQYGVTWVTLDAPLVQVGGITATLLNSQSDPSVWRKTIEPTQKLYSWAMNNHWGTNYRAFQEGPVQFRYMLRPHEGPADDAQATKFATSRSQPLVCVPGRGPAPDGQPLLRVEPENVVVSGLKPSDDGRAIVVRLLNVSDDNADVRLSWSGAEIARQSVSDTSERPSETHRDTIPVVGRQLVTVRAELRKLD